MTVQEKAKDLVDNFIDFCDGTNMFESYERKIALKNAIQCASLAVEEILKAIKTFNNGPDYLLHESFGWKYWNQVKEEINNL